MNQNLGVSIKNLTTQFEHAYLVDQPLQKEEQGEGERGRWTINLDLDQG